MGALSLPSDRFARSGNPAWPGVRTANFAAFGSWSGVLPKNAESLRNSDALMRVASLSHLGKRQPEEADARIRRASASSGTAAPLGCVIFLQFGDVAVFSLCTQYFLNVRDMGGITTLGVLRVLLKRRTAACQNGSFAAFCDEICQG